MTSLTCPPPATPSRISRTTTSPLAATFITSAMPSHQPQPAAEPIEAVLHRLSLACDVSRRAGQPYLYAAKIEDVQRLIAELSGGRSALPSTPASATSLPHDHHRRA